jgi:hypothetical protein
MAYFSARRIISDAELARLGGFMLSPITTAERTALS